MARPHPMVFQTALKNGPAARGFAAMRMTASWLRSSRINRIQGCAALRARLRAPLGIVIA